MIEISVAVANGIFALLVIVVGARLNNKVNKVKDQVVNGHKTNMREEGDERHQENSDKLDLIIRTQTNQGKEIVRVRNNVTKIFDKLDKHTDQIHDLEMTGDRAKLTGKSPRKGRQ